MRQLSSMPVPYIFPWQYRDSFLLRYVQFFLMRAPLPYHLL